MPVVTARAVLWNTTAGVKTTGAFSPAVGDLLVTFVGIATLDAAPTMSDSLGGAWTLVDVFRSQAATGGLRCYVRNSAVSGASMTVTMTPGADAGGGLAVLSVATPRTFGAVRSNGGQADIAAGGTPAPVLSQTPKLDSAILIGLMNNTNGTANQTVRTGYSEHYDLGFNTPPSGIAVQSRNDGETSATLTFGGTTPSIFATVAVEIEISPKPPPLIKEAAMQRSYYR